MTGSKSAVVVYTDIVGFNAMMTRNEEQAKSLLHKNFVLQKNLVDKFQGEILYNEKDEILAIFYNIPAAVKCSVLIQKEIRKEGYSLRIGIHSGKLNNNEGINIADDHKSEVMSAARFLQKISDKGGISVSEKIHASLVTSKDYSFEYSGKKQIESLNKYIEVYKIKNLDAGQENDHLLYGLKRKIWRPFIIMGIIIVLFIILTLLRKVL